MKRKKLIIILVSIVIITIIICIAIPLVSKLIKRNKFLTDKITIIVSTISNEFIEEIYITDKDIIKDIANMFGEADIDVKLEYDSVFITGGISIDFNNGTVIRMKSQEHPGLMNGTFAVGFKTQQFHHLGLMNGKLIYLPEGFVEYIENIIKKEVR